MVAPKASPTQKTLSRPVCAPDVSLAGASAAVIGAEAASGPGTGGLPIKSPTGESAIAGPRPDINGASTLGVDSVGGEDDNDDGEDAGVVADDFGEAVGVVADWDGALAAADLDGELAGDAEVVGDGVGVVCAEAV
ncbi:hypothetical protein QQ045_016281 [Rhodiola kirilowii]